MHYSIPLRRIVSPITTPPLIEEVKKSYNLTGPLINSCKYKEHHTQSESHDNTYDIAVHFR